MGGLNTTLLVGMQALDATQGAIAATSNNIANANTPGYTREVAQFSENQETDSGTVVSGGGVSLDGLQSVRDELLNLQIQQQTSQQSSVNTQSTTLQQIQNYFSTSSGNDISSELAAFSSSLSQLSAAPTSSGAQQGVLSSGQDLANAFNSTANGLTSAQSYANGQVTQTVAQINSLTSQIAQLNGQLTQSATASNGGGTIEDQRDQLVQQLSALTGISVTQTNDGETITTGNGSPLVMGGQSFTLQTTAGSDGMQQVLDSNGNNITASIQGGTLGGAIQVRDQTVPGILTQLNTLASQFATAFNAAQAQGFDPSGNAGQNFFTVPANAANAASGISVAITDPSLIATSSDGSAGSNGNVANLSAVLTNALPSGQSPAGSYASMVFQVGNAASNATSQSTAIGLNLQQLTNLQGSVSAVSTDEETTNLIRFQTAYEAAARIVSTIQQLNTVTLNMGTSGGY
ncbi:MAG TPA: flagellar hook-associated protein FlgK [Acidobacteriaceae bacterium]|jgi:flagellar hook-associated protein 1 FlgK|nr:flagellar hook-associated protein FlgK [Acidobacteriaceae bacterium]